MSSDYDEFNKRISRLENHAAVCSEKMTNMEKENDLFRIAKHEHGNVINLHERDIENLNASKDDMSNTLKQMVRFQAMTLGAVGAIGIERLASLFL